MKVFDHIGIKLAALAITGGTGVMLFASSPVSTDFTAVSSQHLGAQGAFVGLNVTQGSFNVSNLVPGGPANTPQDITFENTGTVPEALNIIFGSITTNVAGLTLSGTPLLPAGTDPLTQLEIVVTPANSGAVTAFGSAATQTFNFSQITGQSGVSFSQANGVTTISGIAPQHLATVLPGTSNEIEVAVSFQLAADGGTAPSYINPDGTVGIYGNDWMNANIQIPYMVQAEAGGSASNPVATPFEPSAVYQPTVS